MKHLVAVCLVVVVIAGTAFAQIDVEQGDKSKITTEGSVVGGDQTNIDLKNVDIGNVSDISLQTGSNNASAQGGEGGDASASVGDNTNLNSNDNKSSSEVAVSVEDKVQGVTPQLPLPLWNAPYPDEKFLWNQLGAEPEELVGLWTKERASSLVDSAGIWFVRGFLIFEGPMKVQSSFDGKYPKTSELNLTLKKPDEAFRLVGEVSVSGKDIKSLICFGRAVEEALKKGADVARIKYGMNTINKGDSAGIGGTYVDSSGRAASTGLLSLGSADSKKQGEPAVILICYKY